MGPRAGHEPKGAFLMAQEVARHMVRLGHGGSIVNIASILAQRASARVVGYAASKAGLEHLTRALAVEWARRGIRVNAIAPGYIETEINADWFATDAGKAQISSFPRRRLMDEDALDQALLLLAGPAARFITGSIITIDDGQSL